MPNGSEDDALKDLYDVFFLYLSAAPERSNLDSIVRRLSDTLKVDPAILAESLPPDLEGLLDRLQTTGDSDEVITEIHLRRAMPDLLKHLQGQEFLEASRTRTDRSVFSIFKSLLHIHKRQLPSNFTFTNKTKELPIKPSKQTFEKIGDWAGWFSENGPRWARPKKAADLPPYGSKMSLPPHERTNSSLVYTVNKDPIKIAVFDDFGTGYYHSRYIALHLKKEVASSRRTDAPALFLSGEVMFWGRCAYI